VFAINIDHVMQRTLRTNIYCATENGYEDCHHRQQEATRVRQTES